MTSKQLMETKIIVNSVFLRLLNIYIYNVHFLNEKLWKNEDFFRLIWGNKQ